MGMGTGLRRVTVCRVGNTDSRRRCQVTVIRRGNPACIAKQDTCMSDGCNVPSSTGPSVYDKADGGIPESLTVFKVYEITWSYTDRDPEASAFICAGYLDNASLVL